MAKKYKKKSWEEKEKKLPKIWNFPNGEPAPLPYIWDGKNWRLRKKGE